MGWALRSTFVVLSAGLALTSCQMTRHPAQPISKIEARTLPPQIVTRRAVAQFADILQLSPYPSSGRRPQNVLEDLWFWTTPRATHVPGLCQIDQVMMEFGPNGIAPADASTPTRVNGINATSFYHFLNPPTLSEDDEIYGRKLAWTNSSCSRIDPEKESLFIADDPYEARAGVILLTALLDKAKSGEIDFELTCANSNEPCIDLLKTASLNSLQSISRCSRHSEVFNNVCTHFTIDSLSIELTGPYSDPKQKISKVSVTELIVLSHERID